MKIYLLAIIAAFGISSSSYAQKLMLGPRAGMDIGTVAWDSTAPLVKKSTTNGFIAAAQLDMWFSDMIALSTGILLGEKGWHEETDDPSIQPAFTREYTLDYIEIPIFLK